MKTTNETTVQHTPGPWNVSFNGTDDTLIFGGGNLARSEKCVAKVKIYYGSALEAEANARLIASAPDLLAVCVRLLAFEQRLTASKADGGPRLAADIRAAIAKAKGL